MLVSSHHEGIHRTYLAHHGTVFIIYSKYTRICVSYFGRVTLMVPTGNTSILFPQNLLLILASKHYIIHINVMIHVYIVHEHVHVVCLLVRVYTVYVY